MADARVINRRKAFICLFIVLLIAVGAVVVAAPVTVTDQYTTSEDTVLDVHAPGVLANDTGGPSLTAILVDDVEHGSLVFNADGSFTYTPEQDFNGEDGFTYKAYDGTDYSAETEVTIDVTPVDDPPIASDDTVIAITGTEQRFYLSAYDVDIDPSHPELHPITFSIVSGPEHGTIRGELNDVSYEMPHTAFVEMVYTSDPEFTGDDMISYSVTDEVGKSDYGTLRLRVVRKRGGSLAGTWGSSCTFTGNPFSIDNFKSELMTSYQIDSATAKAIAVWKDDSFYSLRFDARFTFGELVSVHSVTSFSPSTASFDYWRTRMAFAAAGVAFIDNLYLADSSSSNKLSLKTTIGDVLFSSTTVFTLPDTCFKRQDFTARWDWEECDARVNGRLTFESSGFDSAWLSVKDIPILTSIWNGGIKLGLKLTFTTTSKELTPTLAVRSAWIDCMEVMTSLDTDGTEIKGLDIYGIKLKMDIPTGIKLGMNTSFTDTKNSSLTGYADYFERWTLSGPLSMCCGNGPWKASTYFKCDSASLFDWGMTQIDLDLPLSTQLKLSTRAEFKSVSPYWLLRCGIDISW